jgi:dihydrodipicolinate synthase/N-acetylneuraminate lyase
MQWTGVMPATTTAFDAELRIDYGFVATHAKVDGG